MNFYAIPSFVAFLFNLILGLYVFWRNPKATLNRIFSLLCLIFALWAFSEFSYRSTQIESTAILWARIEGVAWSFFPALFLHFFYVFCQKEKKPSFYFALYLPSAFFALLALTTDLLVAPKVEMAPWGYQEFVGPWFIFFVIYYLIYCATGLSFCFKFWKKAEKKEERVQAKIIFGAALFALILGSITDALLPILQIKIFLSVTHFLFLANLAIAYALAKYSFLPQAPRRSLVFKFVFIVLVLLIFLFGPVSIWFYKKISFEARESVRREAMIIARVASKLIDVEKHEKILSPEDEGTPLYNEVRAKIKELALEDPRIDGIYTLRKTEKENILAFVLDTYDTQDLNGDGIIEPDEERAHVGEEYDISEMSEFQKGFYEVSADYEPICDKWGCWLSGYAPIKDKTGKTVAVLGVDFSAETVKKMEGTFKKGVLAFLFLVLVPIIIALYIVVRLFIRPIKQLEKDFLTFAEDPSHRSKIKTGDEFETLALSFNKMAERIAGIRGELEKGIRERTKELQIKTEEAERLSRLAVGRELKMIDLKKKIKELEEKLKEKLK